MKKISNLDHCQGNGKKAIRYMANTEDKQKAMELLQALLRSKRLETLVKST